MKFAAQCLLPMLAGAALAFPAGAVDKLGERPKISQASKSSGFYAEMDKGMNKMMADMHRAPNTGNPDIDFMAMMIPHHEGAVEMARLVLIYGKDPLVRRLAEEIIASQQVEIDSMKQRIIQLRKGTDVKPNAFPFLGSTRGTSSRP